MRVIGFLKTYDRTNLELLERALKNLEQICGKGNIAVCIDTPDDKSESYQNVNRLVNKYTDHVVSMPDEFTRELEHKQKLLEHVQRNMNADWILALDDDEGYDKNAVEAIPKLCKFGDNFDFDGFAFHEINLWSSLCWIRMDSQFNDLWKINLWKNSPDLKFDTSEGLHRPQNPINLKRILQSSIQILHFGFSSFEGIAEKYVKYKNFGQSGYALDRLRPDNPNIQLIPMNLDLFGFEVKGEPQKKISKEEFDELCKKYE